MANIVLYNLLCQHYVCYCVKMKVENPKGVLFIVPPCICRHNIGYMRNYISLMIIPHFIFQQNPSIAFKFIRL